MFDLHNHSVPGERCIETPGADIKQNFLYVQETGLLKSREPHISHREKMDSFLIIYVLSGEGYFTYKGKRKKVYSGACFYIDCQSPYSHESLEKNSWEILWVHYSGGLAGKYYEYFSRLNDNVFYPQNPMDTADILRQIFQNTQEKALYYELINHKLLTTLLTDLILCQKQQEKSFQNISTQQKLAELQAYLEKNYMNSCSLDELSKQFFMSKYYLSREFKKYFGEGISSYLSKLRITRAKELLRFSDLSTGEIATMCGINDSNHFLKVFKKLEGVTPTEFRRKWRE